MLGNENKLRAMGILFGGSVETVGEKLIFGSQSLLIWAVMLFLLGLALVVWRTAKSPRDGSRRLASSLFKILGLLLLTICLLEPMWSGQRARPGANLFVILADDSQSLTIKDPGASITRGQKLKTLLMAEDQPWQVRLAQDFDLRRYVFDSRLQNVEDFSPLEFKGSQSNLMAALNGLKDRFRDRPLAGILVLTDGIATDAKQTEFHPEGLPPIYPVILGTEARHRPLADLAISHLVTTTTAFEDAPVTIQADVLQTALPKTKVTAEVIDEAGTVVKQATQAFPGDQGPLPFRFQIRPAKPGLSFYEVRVRTEEESNRERNARREQAPVPLATSLSPIVDPSTIEATLANNRRLVAIDRGNTKYRILYLCGRPNWEYKFLRRALESDEQIQLTAVIRIAKKEPKFDWRSKVGEASNPLFRGFDGKSEDTERYDQPVLVRLNTKTPEELREGFPKQAEDLYEFHAVIIDDLESEFFSPDQLALLERFVTERGGGLLMLGGAESFRQGGYEKTPLGRMLPLYLDATTTTTATPTGYRLALTREGWLQPWARLRSTETEEQLRLAEMPNFLVVNRTGQIKPGATTVAEVVDPAGQKSPALAVQSFGRGRCGAMLIGDLWRWQIDRSDSQREKDDLGKAWRQTVRWLIADVPDRIELRTVAKDDLGQPLMRIEARIRTKEYQTQDNAAVTVSLRLPDGTTVTQPAEPSLREAGLYEATFPARQPGCYRVTIDALDQEGQTIGKSETGWTSDPAADEFAQVTPNRQFLEKIAQQTSGEVVSIDGLDAFVRALPNRKAPLTETYTTPLWHQPWVFAAIVACLCADWGLRRWKGQP